MKFLLIYVPNLRFSQFIEPWNNYIVSELLTTFPTNSLSWDQLVENQDSSLKNLHYGLIHNGFETTCITGENQLFPYIKHSFFPTKYALIQNGDLILADASEDRKDVGRPVEMLDISNQKIVSGLHTIHARNKTDLIVNGFKGFYFQSSAMKQQIFKIANGSKIYGISSSAFNELKMFIPEKQEQKKIIDLMIKIEERIQTQSKIISDYNSLKSGVYNWMFKENNVTFKLKQLAHIVKGVQINNDQLLSNGAYYMMNGGTLPSGYLDSYNVSENTISISEGGNSCGYVQFNKERFWSGGHCYTIQNVNPLIVENKYLYHYLKHKEKEIMNLRIGTGLPNIQKKDLENFTIFVPNLLIQRKNLALFEMLDEKICILNEELERLEKQKKYLLRNLFI
ncbi:restriction endonuclease subunit S [Solobacterium moorei]|uniref:Type I restriction modification DNA specificity domain protein n=1 Tax=Solobacterium moorei F0204 TaxID=706433 RepID=E7MMA3_9FIRM|nr:restriction endonuclease subunit S [Solobacterium moorei]EFW24816.1 type I restriction modification DNA specificity domain protein [Solobacterium moorei F0204]